MANSTKGFASMEPERQKAISVAAGKASGLARVERKATITDRFENSLEMLAKMAEELITEKREDFTPTDIKELKTLVETLGILHDKLYKNEAKDVTRTAIQINVAPDLGVRLPAGLNIVEQSNP